MKKIRLNVADLGATEILTREQLKSVFGGIGSGSGSGSGSSSTEVCVASVGLKMTDPIICYGSDRDQAIYFGSLGNDAWWCCNCDTAHLYCD